MNKRKLLWALVLIGLTGLLGWWLAHSWRPSEEGYPEQGFVLDAADAPVNWALVRGDGADFVYLLASWGGTGRSTRFQDDWSAARSAGLRRGALHRYSLCQLARDQVTNFIATVPRDVRALPPALELDFEEGCTSRPGRGVVLKELESFIRLAEMHSGKLMVMRISKAFDAEYAISRAINRPLWLTSAYLLPAYGERPWVMWEANPARFEDGISHTVAWSVVRP